MVKKIKKVTRTKAGKGEVIKIKTESREERIDRLAKKYGLKRKKAPKKTSTVKPKTKVTALDKLLLTDKYLKNEKPKGWKEKQKELDKKIKILRMKAKAHERGHKK